MMQPTSSNDTAKSFCEFMVPLACDVGGFDRIIRHHNKRDGTNVDRLAGSRIYFRVRVTFGYRRCQCLR